MAAIVQTEHVLQFIGGNAAVYIDGVKLTATAQKLAALEPNPFTGNREADDVLRVLCEGLDIWPAETLPDVIRNGG